MTRPLWLLLLSFAFLAVNCHHGSNKKSPAPSNVKKADEEKELNLPRPDKKAGSNATAWQVVQSDEPVTFTIKGPFGKVHGKFQDIRAAIFFDKDDLPHSAIAARTEASTISTGNKLRNHDLQKEKYFNSDKFPLLKFESSEITRSGNGFIAHGTLTMKGVSQQVKIPFSFTQKGTTGTFKGTLVLQREDFHIGKNGGSIGNTVNVVINLPVTRH